MRTAWPCPPPRPSPLTSLVSTELLPRNLSFQSLDSSFSMAGTTRRCQRREEQPPPRSPRPPSDLGQTPDLPLSSGGSPASPGFQKQPRSLRVSWVPETHGSPVSRNPVSHRECHRHLYEKGGRLQRGLSTPGKHALQAVPALALALPDTLRGSEGLMTRDLASPGSGTHKGLDCTWVPELL